MNMTKELAMLPGDVNLSEVLMEISMTTAEQVKSLAKDWHGSGIVSDRVIDEIASLSKSGQRSVETGTGRTTLLLSQIGQHTVFTQDDRGNGGSLDAVQGSNLLNPATEFVLGPTQTTVPAYSFPAIDFALLDGPHGYPFPEIEYYYIYPHLNHGAILVIDDIHIPTIRHLWNFLVKDDMFEKVSIVRTTGFLRRTTAPVFNPLGDGWERQGFNRDSMRTKTGRIESSLRSFVSRNILRRQ